MGYRKLSILAAFITSQSLNVHADISFDIAPFSLNETGQSYVAFAEVEQSNSSEEVLVSEYIDLKISSIDGSSVKNHITADKPSGFSNILPLDINGDEYIDFVTSDGILGLGSGNYEPYAVELWHSNMLQHPSFRDQRDYRILMQEADFDKNGEPDLLVTFSNSPLAGRFKGGTTYVFMNIFATQDNRSGRFGFERGIDFSQPPFATQNVPIIRPTGRSFNAIPADLNNDGYQDIVIANANYDRAGPPPNYSEQSVILLNDQAGSFSVHQFLSFANDLVVEDFDNDGDMDIFLARANITEDTYAYNTPETLTDQLWLNDGSANFSLSSVEFEQQRSSQVEAADFDLDGDIDLVVASQNLDWQESENPIVYENIGGSFLPNFGLSYSEDIFNIQVHDLDKDGDMDAIFTGHQGSKSATPGALSTLSTRLTPNPNLILLSAAIPNGSSGIYTQEQLDQAVLNARNDGIADCQANPQAYGLFDQTDIDNAHIAGQQECIDNPEDFGLQVNLSPAIDTKVVELRTYIATLPDEVFLDADSKQTLFDRIDDIDAFYLKGNDFGAAKRANRLVNKVDGCDARGSAHRGDLIQPCEQQAQAFVLASELHSLLIDKRDQ